ncbi:MAG: hypothetical protein RBT75_19350 [Anaerolineae bacterium]|nr:hypothetical protein [Anaerolineae bacterium]
MAKKGDMLATSATPKSQRKDSQSTDRNTRLKILQQAAFDYQAAGGEVEIITYTDGHGNPCVAIALACMATDPVGKLLPCMHGNPKGE